MKTIISLLLCVLAFAAQATIFTVSNNPNRPAQYENVTDAIAAADHGDTIYVHGSQFTYPDFTINKRLVLIGAGYNSNNEFNFATRVNWIRVIKDAGLQDASGSVITGFFITNRLGNGVSTHSVNDVILFRNRINVISLWNEGTGTNGFCNNWHIYNNIIAQISGRWSGSGATATTLTATNTIIQNNIITGQILDFSSNTIIIDHNIFFGSNNLDRLFYTVVTNNIFMRTTGNVMTGTVSFNTFNNNFSILNTISPTAPTDDFASQSNTAANNIVPGSNPFTDAPSLGAYSDTANYRIAAASQAKDAGTDGTDLGIYGGAFPFPSGGAPGSGYDTSPLPPIPQVTEMNISNTTIQPGTSLNVNVKARVNN
ncbi:MAG: hypothetical protein KF845_14135 [Cyclobacteriaceae bacterium]|nr:hypothetical protein [Cyclobacteriaceae bacterium]